MLIPTSCPVCGARGRVPCGGCASQLRRATSLLPPPGVDTCVALLDYADAGRELVARLKYRNARSSVPFLARGMAVLARGVQVDVVTWAPTSTARRRERGFDQAELLARAVARRLRLRCRPLLRRLPGPPQTGLALAERVSGPAFVARRQRRMPTGVLVVDDVLTSGATLSAAARALHAAGVVEVHAVTAARTPHPAFQDGTTRRTLALDGR